VKTFQKNALQSLQISLEASKSFQMLFNLPRSSQMLPHASEAVNSFQKFIKPSTRFWTAFKAFETL